MKPILCQNFNESKLTFGKLSKTMENFYSSFGTYEYPDKQKFPLFFQTDWITINKPFGIKTDGNINGANITDSYLKLPLEGKLKNLLIQLDQYVEDNKEKLVGDTFVNLFNKNPNYNSNLIHSKLAKFSHTFNHCKIKLKFPQNNNKIKTSFFQNKNNSIKSLNIKNSNELDNLIIPGSKVRLIVMLNKFWLSKHSENKIMYGFSLVAVKVEIIPFEKPKTLNDILKEINFIDGNDYNYEKIEDEDIFDEEEEVKPLKEKSKKEYISDEEEEVKPLKEKAKAKAKAKEEDIFWSEDEEEVKPLKEKAKKEDIFWEEKELDDDFIDFMYPFKTSLGIALEKQVSQGYKGTAKNYNKQKDTNNFDILIEF